MRNKLLIKNKHKFKSPPEGFTLIEVLAGIITATAFVLITTQAIAISALYRVRAQRESLAWQWIQEDFEEEVKFEASQLGYLTSRCGVRDNDGNYTAPTSANGYAQALITSIGGTTTVESPVLLNKAHTATRTLGVKNDAPFTVMTVSYEVRDPDMDTVANPAGKVIADFYTEVIPDAAFNCD